MIDAEYIDGPRKSRASNPNGNCVVVAQVKVRPGTARKARASAVNNCLVAAETEDGQIAVTDSKQDGQPDQPVLLYTKAEWDAFLAGVANGEFTLDENGRLPALV